MHMLHLFSVREELLRYGRNHYRPNSPETSTLLYDLFKAYSEDPDMVDKLKEYVRGSREKFVKTWLPKERLEGLTAAEIVRAIPAETLQELVRLAKANGQPAEEDRPPE